MVRLYGISQCDTMKKARSWLERHGVSYEFHDYKRAGIAQEQLVRWCRAVGWERLLNRNGTTFRKLPEADKARLDESHALALMQQQPSMIRRPVLECAGRIIVGFEPALYEQTLPMNRVRQGP